MSISTEKCEVMGARSSVGVYEGTPYDYTEVYVKEALDPQTATGFVTVPYRFGTSENYRALHGKLPATLELDFLTIANGKGSSKRVVSGIRPVKV